MGFATNLPERVIPDDVQRLPEFIAGLKMEADRRGYLTCSSCKDSIEGDIVMRAASSLLQVWGSRPVRRSARRPFEGPGSCGTQQAYDSQEAWCSIAARRAPALGTDFRPCP